jgi:DNA polymerase-4
MIWNFARGNDHSPVLSLGEAAMVKSVGNSTTTPRDLRCDRDVRLVLLVLSESVAERLRAQGLQGDVVTLQVRNCDLETISCQRKIIAPTALSEEIALHAQQLFRERYHWDKPIRSLGVSVSGLSSTDDDRQISMFPDTRREKLYDLEETVGDIRRRFGHYAISRASLLSDADINGINPRDDHTIHPVGWRR